MRKFLAVLAVLVCVPVTAYAAGALAINGEHYGWAVGYPNEQEAQAAALSQCGSNCSVIMSFSGSCGAFALDQSPDSNIGGWASGASSAEEAQQGAVQACRGRGGTNCVVRASGCDD